MLMSLINLNKEFAQNKLRRVRNHLRTRNVLQFYSVSSAIEILVFWHIVVALISYEAVKYQETTWKAILVLWAAGLFVIGGVALVLLKIYFLNWSWRKAKREIKILPGTLRFIGAIVIIVWVFVKLLILVEQNLPVSGYLGNLELPAALAGVDILLPFGVIGAILLLLGRSDTQNIIAGLQKASPEEKRQILSILKESKEDRSC